MKQLHKGYRAVRLVCAAWTKTDGKAEAQARMIVLYLAQCGLLRNAKVEGDLVYQDDSVSDN